MNKKFLLIVLVVALFFIVSCKGKDNDNDNNNNQNENQTYTVYFDIDGEITSNKYSTGDKIVFPNASKDGYNFVGWKLDGQIITEYVVAKQDVTFVAYFVERNYLTEAYVYLNEFVPSSLTESIELPSEYNGVIIEWTSSKPYVISKTGVVKRAETDYTVSLSAKLSYNGEVLTNVFDITVPKLTDEEILNNALSKFTFSNEFSNNELYLKQDFATAKSAIVTKWESSHPDLIDTTGKLKAYPSEDTLVVLTLTLTLRDAVLVNNYEVFLNAKTTEELLEEAIINADINTNVIDRITYLPTEFDFNILGKWISSDDSILTNEGVVKTFNKECNVLMTLQYWIDGESDMNEKEFNFNINVNTGTRVIRANEFVESGMSNVELKNGLLTLVEGQTYGEYVSEVVETFDYSSLVGSWAATSSKNATVQFFVKVRVNGTWSDYLKYSNEGWGLGLENAATDHTNSLAKLSTDEVKILNSKTANAVQFKLVLRRDTTSYESPKVSLVALALESNTYKGLTYSLEEIPSHIKYDVPKLYQQVVPSIGNSICSATSTTMLLKYKGMDFTSYDSLYEHRYMAGIVRDYGNEIYGNWVYNTVTMGGYGFDAYVARLYSANELAYHLANVGPVAISVKGQMTSDKKNYYTSGHLLCIIGYNYENGVLSFIANDPNVQEVECTYSLSVINSTWRNIIYVIE